MDHKITTKILALDTSTAACSAALFCDNQLVACQEEIIPRQHSNLILPMLDAVLAVGGVAHAQLDALAFGCGPGSFTGVRLAASIIQGIAFASDLPVLAISTLRALAQGAYRDRGAKHVLSSIDAYMQEVYWGVYQLDQHESMVALLPDTICLPADVVVPEEIEWVGVGSGWDSYTTVMQEKMGAQLSSWLPNRYPSARDIASLAAIDYQQGKAVSAEQALPVYLRDKVV